MYAVRFTIKLTNPEALYYSGYLQAVEIIRELGACDAKRELLFVELVGDDLFVLGMEAQTLFDELDALASGVWEFPSDRTEYTILQAGLEVAAR